MILVLVLFAILLSYVSPVVNFFDAWRDSRAERSPAPAASARERRASRAGGTLDGPDAAERAARRLGMVASGRALLRDQGLPR